MMLIDGCFLLQLVILTLGDPSILEYPKDHVIFGKCDRNDLKRWLKSIFYVGNQIPLVVLQKLMEQTFFQKLLAKEKLEEPSDFLRRALYKLLIVPWIQRTSSGRQIIFQLQGLISAKHSQSSIQQSSDLLHGLYSFVTGTMKNPIEDRGQGIDIELGDGEDLDDDKEFPSATQLRQAGIHFKNGKGILGSGEIYFESSIFHSVLYMPTFVVDDNTELMYQYLKDYEMAQQPNRHKRDATAYLKFMSELIRTTEDVKLLASQGIVKGKPIHKEKLPAILSRLAQGESSLNLRHLRLQINEYSRPQWGKLKEFLSIVLILSAVQTVLSILKYVHDIRSSAGKVPSPA